MTLIRLNMALKGTLVLDMGSGPQFTSELLEEEGAKVITLDKYAPCEIDCDINDDFCQYLEDKKFDLIVMGAVIRYVEDKPLFLERLNRILKHGGLVFIDEFIHNPFNDMFLEIMNSMGAMEHWPRENFTPLETLETMIRENPSFSLTQIYSCWPGFFLEGKYPFPVWYSLVIKKEKQKIEN
jgi:SAM-dependent methyltransferase